MPPEKDDRMLNFGILLQPRFWRLDPVITRHPSGCCIWWLFFEIDFEWL